MGNQIQNMHIQSLVKLRLVILPYTSYKVTFKSIESKKFSFILSKMSYFCEELFILSEQEGLYEKEQGGDIYNNTSGPIHKLS